MARYGGEAFVVLIDARLADSVLGSAAALLAQRGRPERHRKAPGFG